MLGTHIAPVCVILLLMLLPGAAAADQRVQEVKNYSLSVVEMYSSENDARLIYKFNLAMVYFTATAWRKENIFDAVKTAARILGQCGIKIQSADLHLLDAPDGFKYYFVPVSREFVRIAPYPKPTVYFVKDTLQAERFDAEAIGRSNSMNRPELRDTVWVALGAKDLGVSLAHELAHLLMDSGEHVDEPENLMGEETTPRNIKLNAVQCDRMRKEGSENGLLKPVGR